MTYDKYIVFMSEQAVSVKQKSIKTYKKRQT